jgi:tRNA 2-selenouridine synthase
MVNYYDPLYRHTLPERRIEVDLEPEETVVRRLQSAVAELLMQPTSLQ